MTNGRGADAVIEGVGHADALKTGFDLLRPWGTISSFGVHNEEIPWTGNQAYGKNLRIQMGRCPVRSKSGLSAGNFEHLKRKDVDDHCRYLPTSPRDVEEESAQARVSFLADDRTLAITDKI